MESCVMRNDAAAVAASQARWKISLLHYAFQHHRSLLASLLQYITSHEMVGSLSFILFCARQNASTINDSAVCFSLAMVARSLAGRPFQYPVHSWITHELPMPLDWRKSALWKLSSVQMAWKSANSLQHHTNWVAKTTGAASFISRNCRIHQNWYLKSIFVCRKALTVLVSVIEIAHSWNSTSRSFRPILALYKWLPRSVLGRVITRGASRVRVKKFCLIRRAFLKKVAAERRTLLYICCIQQRWVFYLERTWASNHSLLWSKDLVNVSWIEECE
jgi:hypothetical protein